MASMTWIAWSVRNVYATDGEPHCGTRGPGDRYSPSNSSGAPNDGSATRSASLWSASVWRQKNPTMPTTCASSARPGERRGPLDVGRGRLLGEEVDPALEGRETRLEVQGRRPAHHHRFRPDLVEHDPIVRERRRRPEPPGAVGRGDRVQVAGRDVVEVRQPGEVRLEHAAERNSPRPATDGWLSRICSTSDCAGSRHADDEDRPAVAVAGTRQGREPLGREIVDLPRDPRRMYCRDRTAGGRRHCRGGPG